MESKIEFLSVTDINRYISYRFDQDESLNQVFIEGEISNFKQSGKHYYLSLKDENSEISAMFFYPGNLSLNFKPVDGMSVQVVGKVQVYQKRGTYAVIIKRMVQCGIGLLYQQFIELKEKLFKEGLFLESHKLPIPQYPEHVGVITAPTGEAINDIISTFNRRFPLAKITLFPAIVQGSDAPKDLIRALDIAYQDHSLDVLIIGRGGGSFEDLACFNDEQLARKLYNAPFPTVSAVGHEGDFTICDFVCSFRAPTPTGAAMCLTKEKKDVLDLIIAYSKRLSLGIKNDIISSFQAWKKLSSSFGLAHYDEIIKGFDAKVMVLDHKLKLLTPDNLAVIYSNKLKDLSNRLIFATNKIVDRYQLYFDKINGQLKKELLLNKITSYSNNCDLLINDLQNNFNGFLKDDEKHLNNLIDKIVLLNPLNIMDKGYSIIYKNELVVKSINDLYENDSVKIRLRDGLATATINKIEKD